MIIQKSRNLGFTIVELIIVISVIGILASLTIVAYNGIQQGARDKAVLSDIENMDAAQTRYSLLNSTSGKAYYSGSGYDADLDFSPSTGDVIDVVLNNIGYCIRGYNTKGNKNSIDSSFTKESQPGMCIDLSPSVAAGGTGTGSLVGWWKLNGSAIDSSGNNFNGTVNGASLTTGQDGLVNSAYSFNGLSDYIGLPGTWGGSSTNEITVSAWYYVLADTGTFASVVESTGASFVHMHLYPSDTGRVYIDTGYAQPINVPQTPIGVWHNLIISSKSGNTASYLDGVLQGSVDAVVFNNITSTTSLQIGRGYSGSRYFNGTIDDVRIYNRALSVDEINTVYSAGAQ